jgi:hypothetical protein
VCSPSNGADLTSLGTPSKRTGQVLIYTAAVFWIFRGKVRVA